MVNELVNAGQPGKVLLDGIELSFPDSKSPLERVRIRVRDSLDRLSMYVSGQAQLALGDDPVRNIFESARDAAYAFTQEVEP